MPAKRLECPVFRRFSFLLLQSSDFFPLCDFLALVDWDFFRLVFFRLLAAIASRVVILGGTAFLAAAAP